MKRFFLVLLIITVLLVTISCGSDDVADTTEHVHSFSLKQEVKASCTEQGYSLYACSCGITNNYLTGPFGHSYVHGACERCGIFASASEGLGYIFNSETETYTLVDASDCKDKDVVIPETYNGKPVDTIQIQVFIDYPFESISIPSTVKYIDQGNTHEAGTFDTINLVQINVHPDNPVFASVDNCLIDKTTKTLVLGCKNSKIPSDGSVKIIGGWAFYNCEDLETLEIPEGVETIYAMAFYYCRNLKTVNIPSTMKIIGTDAFGTCPALEKIYFSQSVEKWRVLAEMDGDPDYDPDFEIGPYYPITPLRDITVICTDGRIIMTSDDFDY